MIHSRSSVGGGRVKSAGKDRCGMDVEGGTQGARRSFIPPLCCPHPPPAVPPTLRMGPKDQTDPTCEPQ